MPGVTATLALSLAARLTGASIEGDSPTFNANIDRRDVYEPGTGAINQADLLLRQTRTIAASGNEDRDLIGALTDAIGGAFAAAEIVAIIVEADEANTNDVVFGPAAANGFLGPFGAAAHKLSVQPGDYAVLTSKNGWPVTPGTGDLLNFANSGAGTGVDYTLTVIGRTVAA